LSFHDFGFSRGVARAYPAHQGDLLRTYGGSPARSGVSRDRLSPTGR